MRLALARALFTKPDLLLLDGLCIVLMYKFFCYKKHVYKKQD